MTKKIEKGIRYSEELDTYYVQFNYSSEAHLRSFPTLKDARTYRDAINAAKLEAKIKNDSAIIHKKEAESIKDFTPYPYNVFESTDLKGQVESSVIEHFEDILYEICDAKEQLCVLCFFKNGCTLEQCGKQFNFSKERARQIIARALKKIVSHIYQVRLNKKIEADLADRRAMRKNLIEAYKENGVITPELEFEFGELRIGEVYPYGVVPLDNLDLSTRTYNALKRARIYTVNELTSRTEESLYRIRCLGEKAVKEIKDKVSKLGFCLASDDY